MTTSPEDEVNLHTDGEIYSGETKLKNNTTENEKKDGQIVKVDNRTDTGGLHIQKILGCDFKHKKLVPAKHGTTAKRHRNR